MRTYSTCDARARLSALLDQVEESGETITITRRGKPVAKVVPIEAGRWRPIWGPNPALTVVINEDPTTPVFPDGLPADDDDPL